MIDKYRIARLTQRLVAQKEAEHEAVGGSSKIIARSFLCTTKQPNNKKQQSAKNCYHQLKNKITLFLGHI